MPNAASTPASSLSPSKGREIWDDLCHRRQGQQIENDYDKEVYNGDIGYIEAIDLRT